MVFHDRSPSKCQLRYNFATAALVAGLIAKRIFRRAPIVSKSCESHRITTSPVNRQDNLGALALVKTRALTSYTQDWILRGCAEQYQQYTQCALIVIRQ